MNHRWDDTGIAKFTKLWPIILSALVAAIAFGSIRTEVTENQDLDKRQEFRLEKQGDRIARLEQAVQDIPEIRRDIKEILRRVR